MKIKVKLVGSLLFIVISFYLANTLASHVVSSLVVPEVLSELGYEVSRPSTLESFAKMDQVFTVKVRNSNEPQLLVARSYLGYSSLIDGTFKGNLELESPLTGDINLTLLADITSVFNPHTVLATVSKLSLTAYLRKAFRENPLLVPLFANVRMNGEFEFRHPMPLNEVDGELSGTITADAQESAGVKGVLNFSGDIKRGLLSLNNTELKSNAANASISGDIKIENSVELSKLKLLVDYKFTPAFSSLGNLLTGRNSKIQNRVHLTGTVERPEFKYKSKSSRTPTRGLQNKVRRRSHITPDLGGTQSTFKQPKAKTLKFDKKSGFVNVNLKTTITPTFRDKLMGVHLSEVLQSARFTPAVKGTVGGFRMTQVRSNSLFAKIGLLEGDVVTDVNGSSLGSAAEAIGVLQQLRDTTSFRVGFLRKGKVKHLELTVLSK